jgi:hypothetical protein
MKMSSSIFFARRTTSKLVETGKFGGWPAPSGYQQSAAGATGKPAANMGALPGMGKHPQYTRTWLRTMSDKPAGELATYAADDSKSTNLHTHPLYPLNVRVEHLMSMP